MRVSEVYKLDGDQASFDFIDVHVDRDTELFIDPSVLAQIDSSWAAACASSVQTFFQEVLDRIIAGDKIGARRLMEFLGEDNSTHLGYSSRSAGSGVGPGLAEAFFKDLVNSEAVRSGLITDLEDTALLVDGVAEDRISDVTTSLIRQQLAEYTQETSNYYGIPLSQGLNTGRVWDPRTKSWKNASFALPVALGKPLTLVPKSIVRRALFINPGEYYRYYVLEYYREKELKSVNSPLACLLKNGERRVNKGDVEKHYRSKHADAPSIEKRINQVATTEQPDLIDQYKQTKRNNPPTAISPENVSKATDTDLPDVQELLNAVKKVSPGKADADAYERAIEALLSSLFYPYLVNPKRQHRIHQGRKRLDISYTNMGGKENFLAWLLLHFPAANVVVECKNFSGQIANPELDQLTGRFSPSRGRYGLLIVRNYDPGFLVSCRDTANDDRGYVTPLSDADLQELVDEFIDSGSSVELDGLLHKRFRYITNDQ